MRIEHLTKEEISQLQFLLNKINPIENANSINKSYIDDMVEKFAIEFAKWCDENLHEGDSYIKGLEIFKKEKAEFKKYL